MADEKAAKLRSEMSRGNTFGMTKRYRSLLWVATNIAFLAFLPTVAADNSLVTPAAESFRGTEQSQIAQSRIARLRHGVNLSHWFAQSGDYSKTHLESHTTGEDIALIKNVGFDHVRLTIEPALLFNWDDPSKLKAEQLKYLDNALDLILTQGLAVVVDIHPSDEFKVKLNSNDRQIEAFGKFWQALAQHLSRHDPERVFLEVINEPMVEDGYRWFYASGRIVGRRKFALLQKYPLSIESRKRKQSSRNSSR
jgi:aryl-phospho-beta-D-glucosidase BglC (GH1 family)